MIFHGVDDQELELEITRLEFSRQLKQIVKCQEPLFLMIHVKIKSKFGCFEHKNPLLDIGEVNYLIKWLEKLSKNKCKEKELQGTYENFFRFELLNSENDDIKKIRIYFYEDPWYFIDANISNSQLIEYSNLINKELKRFYKVLHIRNHFIKAIEKGINSLSDKVIIEENASLYRKNNFVDRYDLKKGYKIIYSKMFVHDLNKIKNNFVIKEKIENKLQAIKKYPYDNHNSSWDDFSSSRNITFRIIDKYIIFFQPWMYDEIIFLRMLNYKPGYKEYLKNVVSPSNLVSSYVE